MYFLVPRQSDDLPFFADANLCLACLIPSINDCIRYISPEKMTKQNLRMLNLLTVLDYVEVFMSPSVFGVVAHVLADRSIEKLRLSFYFSGHRVYCKEKRLFGNRRCHRRTPSRFSHFLSLHSRLQIHRQ